MRERRALRFLVEALFLAALAAAVIFADLDRAEIVGVMLLGWLVVALFEWAATRDRPHYGRGLPPRYYVPQVSLPPPRPLEQLATGYPAAGFLDEEPTWIASAEMREQMLAEWPVAAGVAPGEETVVDELLYVAIQEDLREDTWLEVPVVESEDEREVEPVAVTVAAPEPGPEPEVAAVVVQVEPEPEPEVAVAVAVVVAQPEREPDPEPSSAERVEAVVATVVAAEVVEALVEPEPQPTVAAPGVAEGRARHRFDPLDDGAQPRRRWRRRGEDDDEGFADVPARPPTPAGLPGHSRREQ